MNLLCLIYFSLFEICAEQSYKPQRFGQLCELRAAVILKTFNRLYICRIYLCDLFFYCRRKQNIFMNLMSYIWRNDLAIGIGHLIGWKAVFSKGEKNFICHNRISDIFLQKLDMILLLRGI